MPEDIHIVPHGTEWDVTTPQRKTSISHFANKQDAIEFGRELAFDRDVSYVIHRRDGTVQTTRTPTTTKERAIREIEEVRATTRRDREPMAFPAQHVLPWQDDHWAIKSDNLTEPSEIHATKYTALGHAKRLARESGQELVVHYRDGTEQARWNPREEWRPTLLYLGA